MNMVGYLAGFALLFSGYSGYKDAKRAKRLTSWAVWEIIKIFFELRSSIMAFLGGLLIVVVLTLALIGVF
jgi:uncharacterized membrane protein